MIKNKESKWVRHIIKNTTMSKNGKTKVSQTVVIGQQYIATGLFLVSPLTDFVNQYSNKKTTTQISYADVVVHFLNFISKRQPLEIDNLTEQDVIDFLDSCDANSQTKNSYARKLEKFYLFLKEHDMLANNVSISFVGKSKNNNSKTNVDKIHDIKDEYLPLFIKTAFEEVPEIAVGVVLQCCGGLRVSEVVSIEYNEISYRKDKNNQTTVIINLHDKDLRPDLEYAFLAKNKKERKQEIIPAFDGVLINLLDKHKEQFKSDKTNAVFIDEKGVPMTSATYTNRFKKLKKKFIKRLEQSNDFEAQTYAMYLQTFSWGTHICRGIFSNRVANATNNIGEIALWRGDSNMSSALTYLIDKTNLEEKSEDVMGNIYKEAQNYDKGKI